MLQKGLYRHQYCTSVQHGPIKINFHFEDSSPITPLIKFPQSKIDWLQNKLPSIRGRPSLKIVPKEIISPNSQRNYPMSPFTMILKRKEEQKTEISQNNLNQLKHTRYQSVQLQTQFIVNKYMSARPLNKK